MAKRAKKAFTIVELVIVIAVVAILMAVLIPTFVSLVKKANVSSDSQLVRNLNTILTAEGVTEGKNPTMHDALEDAFENGYDITKISPTSEGNDIVWDSVSDRFALVEAATGNPVFTDSETTLDKKVDLWKIYDEMPQEQSYSIYASRNWTAETVPALKVGFDAGNAAITSVTYDRSAEMSAQNVVIRTNGGYLEVNAPEDNVYHYGVADDVNVIAVKGQSYHERGTTAFAKIQSGHIIAEEGGKILLIQRTSVSATVDVDGGEIQSAVATSEELKITTIQDVVCEVKTEEEIATIKEEKIVENIEATVDFTNCVARIGRNGYATLKEATENAKSNDIITIIANETLTTLTIGTKGNARNIVIDLPNDKTVTIKKIIVYDNLILIGEGTWLISATSGLQGFVAGAHFEINAVTIKHSSGSKGPLLLANSGSSVVMNSGTIIGNQGIRQLSYNYGIVSISKGASFVMNGGLIENKYAVSETIDYGKALEVKGTATVNGGTIKSNNEAIYSDDNSATVTVNSGVFFGSLTDSDGKLYIMGGTFVGATESVYAYGSTAEIYISGGDFSVKNEDKRFVLNKLDSVKDNAVIEVTGGTFHGYNPAESASEKPAQNFVKDGYQSVENNGVWTVSISG